MIPSENPPRVLTGYTVEVLGESNPGSDCKEACNGCWTGKVSKRDLFRERIENSAASIARTEGDWRAAVEAVF